MKDCLSNSRTFRYAAILLAFVGVGGCQTTNLDQFAKIQAEVAMSSIEPAKQLDLSVAVLVPPDMPNASWVGAATSYALSACLSNVNFQALTKVAAEKVLSKVFVEVAIVEDENFLERFDLIMKPAVNHFSWSSGGIFTIHSKLSMDVKVTNGQKTAWKKSEDIETSASGDFGCLGGKGNVEQSVQKIAETSLVKFFSSVAIDIQAEEALWQQIRTAKAHLQEEQARILTELKDRNADFRVIEGTATVRYRPNAESQALDTYPTGSIIHVIGELPDGWLRVAREGKPFGWVHGSAVQPEETSGGKQTVQSGSKPSIFLAYPKGGEELAEDSVNVVGYVTSANRTEEFAVAVNRFPLNVSSLWKGTALDTKGLRGYPVELVLPLQMGENSIQFQVRDAEGFVERKTLVIKRVEISEDTQITSIVGLPLRFPNVEVVIRDQSVTSDNFMAVLGDWVKDTAKSDYNKGNTMFDQGRFARAAYYYRKSIKTEPLGQAWFNLGISEKAIGNETEANKAFATACQLEIFEACDLEG